MMWAWLAVWTLTSVAAVVLVWRWAFDVASPRRTRRMLDLRLARGEIDVGEHRRAVDELAADRRVHHGPSTQLAIAIAVLIAMLVLLAGASVAWAVTAYTWSGWDIFGMRAHHQAMHGGGTDTSGAPLTSGTSAQAIGIAGFAFSPGNMRVPLGATITWTNADDAPHDASAEDGSWKTPTLLKGKSASITLDRAGEYPYRCSIHPDMQARILVQ